MPDDPYRTPCPPPSAKAKARALLEETIVRVLERRGGRFPLAVAHEVGEELFGSQGATTEVGYTLCPHTHEEQQGS